MANINEIQNKYFWFINGDRIGIVEKNENNLSGEDSFVSPKESGATLRYEYIARPLKFTTDLATSSELPEQFHEALAFKVIADLYRLPGENFNLQLSQYFDNLYLAQVREGKKYASKRRVTTGYIKPVDY